MQSAETLTPRQMAEIADLVAIQVAERLSREQTGPTLLNREQVAQRLGLSTASVERYTRAGRIPFIKIGNGPIRYDIVDVIDKLREGSV